MSFNLVQVLPQEDKNKIKKYIETFGVSKNFIGVDEWLKYWGKSKIKMYKMLGNQFIYKFPFEYEKDKLDITNEMRKLLYPASSSNEVDWRFMFFEWLSNNCSFEDSIIPYDVKQYFDYDCCTPSTFARNEVSKAIKFKLPNSKKMLQLNEGMKPMKAISKFLNYCKDLDGAASLIDSFENFRIAHSMILNDKTVKGNLVISIHPLDFMSMSDNNSNWSSCMSWKDNGCYRVGTIEMMNSNNVLCCYLESDTPFDFEDCEWANKRWRQLVYFTKDIIVSGKPYPYAKKQMSIALIEKIRELAKENLNWNYSFGPELYKDMKYIGSAYTMSRAKNYIYFNNMKKHNIIFDTKGMYNDMLNDHGTQYWCVRNKVKHNKVISYSGFSNCLCCNNEIINCSEDYDYDYDDYNERYWNVGSLICDDCYEDFACDFCGDKNPKDKHYIVHSQYVHGSEFSICKTCFKEYIKKCPDCNEPFYVSHWFDNNYPIELDGEINHRSYIKINNNKVEDVSQIKYPAPIWITNMEEIKEEFEKAGILPVCRCNDCLNKDDRFEKSKVSSTHWGRTRTEKFYISKDVESEKNWEKYFPYNLKKVKPQDNLIIKC